MNEFINQLAFGWYPYLAVTVLVVGSIFRFDADQYSWRSQSSQFLRRKQMVIGSNLFHMGVLIEEGPTEQVFQNPREARTQDYITGRIG